MTIFEIAKKVQSGEVKAAGIAKEYLKRIEEKNNSYNVFLYINKDIVNQAKEIDERVAKRRKCWPACGSAYRYKR